MFFLDRSRIIHSKLPLIKENYRVLHFDEYPILFYGTNAFGNKIVGSFVCEHEDNDYMRYYHMLVSNKVFDKFIHRRITYLEVMKETEEIYVLDKDINDRVIDTFLVNFSELPDDHVPLEGSFAPVSKTSYGYDFVLRLNGRLASISQAIPEQLSTIQTSFSRMLTDTANLMSGLGLETVVRQLPYSEGSFKLNFHIEFKGTELFLNLNDVTDLTGDLIKYTINDFATEYDSVFENGSIEGTQYSQLKSKLLKVHTDISKPFTDEQEKVLKNQILRSAEAFEEISIGLGQGFSEIELTNRSARGQEIPIGLIDREKIDRITGKIEKTELETSVPAVVEKSPRKLKIYIYSLNTESRQGFAQIYDFQNPEMMHKVKIRINGNFPLEKTKFTMSLHENLWIEVMGITRIVGNRITSITITEI